MGNLASKSRRALTLRPARLSETERAFLKQNAQHRPRAYHKRNPGDFGLVPPNPPRPDKTLCDDAGILSRAEADALFQQALDAGIAVVSEPHRGYPEELWVVDANGRPFVAKYALSQPGSYHGYPARRDHLLWDEVLLAWENLGD